MTRPLAVLSWLEDRSDWLSPIIVKEVRQVMRGREFVYSFAISLIGVLLYGLVLLAERLVVVRDARLG